MQIRSRESKVSRQPHKTQTYLVPLTGNDRPGFGMMEQNAVVEQRRVLGGRRISPEVIGTARKPKENYHKVIGTTMRPQGPATR